jgi:hypothetical protein
MLNLESLKSDLSYTDSINPGEFVIKLSRPSFGDCYDEARQKIRDTLLGGGFAIDSLTEAIYGGYYGYDEWLDRVLLTWNLSSKISKRISGANGLMTDVNTLIQRPGFVDFVKAYSSDKFEFDYQNRKVGNDNYNTVTIHNGPIWIRYAQRNLDRPTIQAYAGERVEIAQILEKHANQPDMEMWLNSVSSGFNHLLFDTSYDSHLKKFELKLKKAKLTLTDLNFAKPSTLEMVIIDKDLKELSISAEIVLKR